MKLIELFGIKRQAFPVVISMMLPCLLLGCGQEDRMVYTEVMQEEVELEDIQTTVGIEAVQEVTEYQNSRIAQEEEKPQVTEEIEDLLEPQAMDTQNEEVTLIMVGDMLMHTPVNESGVMEDGSIDFSHLFNHTKDMIESADIALVNQEVILGGEELGISGYPAFNTYYELGDALVDAGFDVMLHATNHALDKGKKGIINCLAYWEESYPEIAVLGIQNSQEEQDAIYVCEKNGIRIAILNYTYGTNGIPLPEDMPYAVNLMDKQKMEEDIEKAKEFSDFVVVCPHWGTEYVLETVDYQENYAEFMLELGVDLVLGTHPHVIEPVEWMRDEEGHEMLVYYSLGNYVNCTSSETEDIGQRMLGAMATVTIAMDDEGEAYIKEYGAEPLVTYVSDDQEEIAVYPLDQFTDGMAFASHTIKYDTDFSKSYCEELWEEIMGKNNY